MAKHIFFFFCLFTVCSFLNFSNSLYANHLSPINVLTTACFLLGLCLYSFYNGKKGDKNYGKFIIIYWGIILISAYIEQTSYLHITNILVILNIVPMYALMYGHHIKFMVILILTIEILTVVISYLIGRYFRHRFQMKRKINRKLT